VKILVIDDKSNIAEILRQYEQFQHVEVHCVHTLKDGSYAVDQQINEGFDVVLMREKVAGELTIQAIQDFKTTSQLPEVLIYTDHGDPEIVEQALENGAWDYIVGPELEQNLPDVLKRLFRYRQNRVQSFTEKRKEIAQKQNDQGIIGSSAAIQACVDQVSRVAHSDASVLITGETGTGKEVFARAIHSLSPRCSRNLTIVDCATLPSTLVESLLFGHIKGAFTGADSSHNGLIKQADGGTLFLDEVGEMPLEIQKKFLRVLQERNYLPVGSRTVETSNFRLVAATNKNIERMVAEGAFREDLFYRLKTFQLDLPPLRERRSDIAELAYFFRNRLCRQYKLKRQKLSTNYLVALNSYGWPGNVRELSQAIEHSISDAFESTVLEKAHLPLKIRLDVTKKFVTRKKDETEQAGEGIDEVDLSSMPTIKEDRDKAISQQEKRYLRRLLKITNGNIKLCCETAGLSRSRLYDLFKKHGFSQKKTT